MKQKRQAQSNPHQKVKKSKRISKAEATKNSKASKEPIPIANRDRKDDIFEEEDSKQNDHQILVEADHKTQAKEQERELSQIEEALDLPNCNTESRVTPPVPKAKNSPAFQTNFYDPVEEIDFDIYTTALTKGKMYSVMLLDKFGKIIYSDKLGSELFEGSLNNFKRIRIQDMLVINQRAEFCQTMNFIKDKMRITIAKMVIYSKNAKRRYSQKQFTDTLTVKEIYHRFLKSISGRLRPVSITFQNHARFEGFWSQGTVQNNVPIQCFMLEARLSKKLPNLTHYNLMEDPIILKYIASNKKKIGLKGKASNRQDGQYENESSNSAGRCLDIDEFL